MSQSQCGWSSSQTSYRSSALVGHYPTNYLIGRRPLHRRLAALTLRSHAVLAPVSQRYPPPMDTFLRVTHPSATEAECPPCDLHVLSMPPAFALSQDQTLRFISKPIQPRVSPKIFRAASSQPTLHSLSIHAPSPANAQPSKAPTPRRQAQIHDPAPHHPRLITQNDQRQPRIPPVPKRLNTPPNQRINQRQAHHVQRQDHHMPPKGRI